MTDDLIAKLAADTAAVPRAALSRRFGLGMVVGAVVCFALVLTWLGLRPDMDDAMHGMRFWMKASYTLWVALASLPLAIAFSRPDGRVGVTPWLVLAFAPVFMLAMTAMELMRTPESRWMALVVGSSAMHCSWRILLLSIPIFGALVWVFKRLAPTRLAMAGLTAGLIAGGLAATMYGLHCQEPAVTFVTLWYTLGMVAAGALGALVGPRLMRW
ncbi:hypothetical protein QO010_001330 [Caulobacter ginsengisoli]|uniref:DUF1109 domain-containing protein n=1 Tax=Caulobacter ginsengisoli TaxID=400775 RepID=A0ABU0IRD5_9CAUL|nr:DUF1109 domain-containing protein [Caulobacter ginsengisoli]MDQ0463559.1 hypothetical protein [Caulobacter ginsengisoli]